MSPEKKSIGNAFWRRFSLCTALAVAAIAAAIWGHGAWRKYQKADAVETATAQARVNRLFASIEDNLQGHWSHFQKDVHRTFAEFTELSAVSFFFPKAFPNIRTTYIRLATRDFAFAPKKAPYKVEGTKAWYKDEDFLGDVVTDCEIPVATGERFKATRILKDLIPAIEGTNVCETIDTRFETAAMVKRRLAAYREKYGSWRLWCVGLNDYVVTPGGARTADFYFDAFLDDSIADLAAQISILSPADLFASYVGTDRDLSGALDQIDDAISPLDQFRLPFPEGERLALRASDITPVEPVEPSWLAPGTVEEDLFTPFTNRIDALRRARVTTLEGYLSAARSDSTNAVALWAESAKINPDDPILMNLGDILDMDARRYLAIGNVNGALNCYENRAEIFPDDVATIHNFGVCLKKAGKSDVALRAFKRAIAMDPLDDSHRMELVEAAEAAGKIDVAARQADILSARHPKDPAIMLLAAKLWARSSNPARDKDKALKLASAALRAARDLGADEKTYRVGLADVLIECGEVAQGMKIKRELRK